MRYLLDTNIISNIVKPAPSESLVAWMAEQVDQDLYIASLTIAEIRRGVLEKPAGKRREELEPGSPAPKGRRCSLPAASCPSMSGPASSGRGSWRTARPRASLEALSTPSLPPWQRRTPAWSSPTTRGISPGSRFSTPCGGGVSASYSHSIVPGGFDVMS
jgi:hypothetical protein